MTGTGPAFPRFFTGVAENFGRFRAEARPEKAVFSVFSTVPGI